MGKSLLLDRGYTKYLFLDSCEGKFAVYDVERYYVGDSSFRTTCHYFNIMKDKIFDVSEIDYVSYCMHKDGIVAGHTLAIHFLCKLNYGFDEIRFRCDFEKVSVYFYIDGDCLLTEDIKSECDEVHSLEMMFDNFKCLPKLGEKYALIPIADQCKQTDTYKPFYKQEEYSKLRTFG